jgi:hypothetical protein
MAKKDAQTPKAELSRIIQTSLLPEEIEEIQNVKANADDLFRSMEGYMANGVEFSFIINSKSNGSSVLVKQTKFDSPNAGSAFYSNGPNLRIALVAALFKLQMLGDKSWESFFASRSVGTGIS